MKRFVWISLITLFSLNFAFAQTGGYQVGDAVAVFKLKNIDGKTVSLADYTNAKGIIVIFTSNHCPFAKAYEDRIIALNNKYSSRNFPVIAINPSDPGTHMDDSFEKMKDRASAKGYTYPYLQDDAQTTARAFGVARTPQAFVLTKTNGKFTVAYIGLIDDNPQDPAGASKFYVDEAVTNLLEGKPVVTLTTKPVGCAIKWKN
ncbi:thioredoxin family protein [Dyadobacter sp. 3J3]|uniref:thioredoxin family protein n=1 Tax=Dyadobacter sp. 3J3 TaxID=2606600 RepID=UPI00135A7A7F|nr:thioredoxin family protein [Dyadobacter sp. 3J3]